MKIINVFRTVFIAIMFIVQQIDAVSRVKQPSLYKQAKVGLQAIIAPLYAGYGYTEKEKEAARNKLAKLKAQREEILREYWSFVRDSDLSVTVINQYWDLDYKPQVDALDK